MEKKKKKMEIDYRIQVAVYLSRPIHVYFHADGDVSMEK